MLFRGSEEETAHDRQGEAGECVSKKLREESVLKQRE